MKMQSSIPCLYLKILKTTKGSLKSTKPIG
jgi:hypothetical protein